MQPEWNLTDMCEKILQQVPDNTNYQKWSIGQIDSDYQIRNIVKKNTPLPLYEEIYFDKSLGVIRVLHKLSRSTECEN